MNAPMPKAVQCLIDAAAALLEARANQMVTSAEWQVLERAVRGCGGRVPEVEPDRE